jgi:hypothetical protein
LRAWAYVDLASCPYIRSRLTSALETITLEHAIVSDLHIVGWPLHCEAANHITRVRLSEMNSFVCCLFARVCANYADLLPDEACLRIGSTRPWRGEKSLAARRRMGLRKL